METNLVLSINEAIETFVRDLHPGIKRRASSWGSLSGSSKNVVHDAVRLGRLLKKFERPEEGDERRLERLAVVKAYQIDVDYQKRFGGISNNGLGRAFVSTDYWDTLSLTSPELVRLKLEFSRFFREFRVDWTLCDFGPGSNYIQDDGRRTPFAKYVREELDSTRGALKMFRKHIAFKHKTWRLILAKRAYSDIRRKIKDSSEVQKFIRFQSKLMGVSPSNWLIHYALVHTITIVPGERMVGIPKNNSAGRPIGVGPVLNTYLQKGVGSSLKIHLHRIYGVDLFLNQELHGRKSADLSFATVDFSSASNSITASLVKFLCPRWVFKMLDNLRSRMWEYQDNWFHPACFSAMGCGFTFELLTLTLLAAQRAVGSTALNLQYGDDTIIPTRHVNDYVNLCQKIGFVVNRDKTFLSGEIRESCGAFHYRGRIQCFDIKWSHELPEAIATVNKIYLYSIDPHSNMNFIWMKLWQKLASILSQYSGPVPAHLGSAVMDAWVWNPGFIGKPDNSALGRWLGPVCGSVIFSLQVPRLETVDFKGEYNAFEKTVKNRLRVDNLMDPVDNYRGCTQLKHERLIVNQSGHILGTKKHLYAEHVRLKALASREHSPCENALVRAIASTIRSYVRSLSAGLREGVQ